MAFGIQKFALYSGWTHASSIEFWQIRLFSSFQQAALVLNASRRFRYTLDLKKEEEKEIIRRKIRSHAQVIRVLCHFLTEILYSCFLDRFIFFVFWIFILQAAFLFKEAGQKDTSGTTATSYCYFSLYYLCPFLQKHVYYYAISYHSILVKASDKKSNESCFHCSFLNNMAVFLVAMCLRAQFYIII